MRDCRKLNANVSLKLTHMGLDVNEKLAREIVSRLVEHAAQIENFVRIDMEGSLYTEKTLEVVRLGRELRERNTANFANSRLERPAMRWALINAYRKRTYE